MADQTATGKMDVDELARLEAAARDRWGDGWTIDLVLWADGSFQAFALHSHGVVERDDVDESVLEKERLYFTDDGDLAHDRIHKKREEVVEVLKTECLTNE